MVRRNAALDILRAAAIILVVNCHIASTVDARGAMTLLQAGGKGVDLFFVLSGWLLGRQLLKEVRDTASIDIMKFWFRRWLRTLPAYYVVLLATCGWQVAAGHASALRFGYLVFAQNYEPNLPYFGVSWSLCVEEHFYLLIAPSLLLFFRFRKVRPLLIPLLLLPLVCRYMSWYGALHETHVRYDECSVGVLLAAIDVFAPRLWRILCRFAPYLAIVAVAALAHPLLLRAGVYEFASDYDGLGYAVCFAILVLLANSSSFFSDRLRSRYTSYVAERAYAIYLMHPEALALLKRLGPLPGVVSFMIAWVVSLAMAEILYRLVEAPFMRLRERWPARAGAVGQAEATASQALAAQASATGNGAAWKSGAIP